MTGSWLILWPQRELQAAKGWGMSLCAVLSQPHILGRGACLAVPAADPGGDAKRGAGSPREPMCFTHHHMPRCSLPAGKQEQEPELWDSSWRWPRHPPEPFPASRQRKCVLRAAGDGPFPPLGFSFSFFALFRYVKISGGKLGWHGAGAVQSHGSWCGAVLPAWGHPAHLLLSPFGQRCCDASPQQV